MKQKKLAMVFAFFAFLALAVQPATASIDSIKLADDASTQFVATGATLKAQATITATTGTTANVSAYLLKVSSSDLAKPEAFDPRPFLAASQTVFLQQGKKLTATASLSIPFTKPGIYKVLVTYSTDAGDAEARFWFEGYKYYLLDGSVVVTPKKYSAKEYIEKYEDELLEIAYGKDASKIKQQRKKIEELSSKAFLNDEEKEAYAKAYAELINVTSRHYGVFEDEKQRQATIKQVLNAFNEEAVKEKVFKLLNDDLASLTNLVIYCNSDPLKTSLFETVSTLGCDSYAYAYQRDFTAFVLQRIQEQQASGSEDVMVRLARGDSSLREELESEFKERVLSAANDLQAKLFEGQGKIFAPKSELINLAVPGQTLPQLNIPKVIEEQDLNSPFSERMAFYGTPQTTINKENCLQVLQSNFYKGSPEATYCSYYVALLNLREDLPALDKKTPPSPVVTALIEKGGSPEGLVQALNALRERAEKLYAFNSALDYANQTIELSAKYGLSNNAVKAAQRVISSQYSTEKTKTKIINCLAPFAMPEFIATMAGAMALSALTGGAGAAVLGYAGDAATAYSVYSIAKNSIEKGELEVTPCEIAFIAFGVKTSTTLSKLKNGAKKLAVEGVKPATESLAIKLGKAIDSLEASWPKTKASFLSRTPKKIAATARTPIKKMLGAAVEAKNRDKALKALESPFYCGEIFCSSTPQIGTAPRKQVDSATTVVKPLPSEIQTSVVKEMPKLITSEPTVPQLIRKYVKENKDLIAAEISRATGKKVTKVEEPVLLGKGRFKTALEITYKTADGEKNAVVVSALSRLDDFMPLSDQIEEINSLKNLNEKGIGAKTFFAENPPIIEVEGFPRLLYFTEYVPREVPVRGLKWSERDKLFGKVAAREWESGGAVADPHGGNLYVQETKSKELVAKYIDAGGYGEALKPWQQIILRYASGELYFFDAYIKSFEDFFEGFASVAGETKTKQFLKDAVKGFKEEVLPQSWYQQPRADKVLWVLHDGKGFAGNCFNCNEVISLSASDHALLETALTDAEARTGMFEEIAEKVFGRLAKKYGGRYTAFSHATAISTEEDAAKYTQIILEQIKSFAEKKGWKEVLEEMPQ
jgi:hypothetical protein